MRAICLALIVILFAVLLVWELRRPLRLLRASLLPALRAAGLRRLAGEHPLVGTSRDFLEGRLVRVGGQVVPDPSGRGRPGDGHAVASQWTAWGELGEAIEHRTECEDFYLRLSDNQLVRVSAVQASKRGRLHLLDGTREHREGPGFATDARRILVGQFVEVTGCLQRTIDFSAASPHPRALPTSWTLTEPSTEPMTLRGGGNRIIRRRENWPVEPSGRFLAAPVFFMSVFMLVTSTPTGIGWRGVFPFLFYAGISGALFSLFVAIAGAPGIFRTWPRWLIAGGFLGAAMAGFWLGLFVRP